MELLPTQRLKDLFNTPDEISAIKSVCRQVLSSLNLNLAPVPLKPICQRFNLKVNYSNAIKNEDSILKLTPTGFEIEISKQKSWRRNRFTIAHEIVHLIIFSAIDVPISSNDISQYKEVEKLCDIGASELLINEDELDRNMKIYGINKNGLKAIYDNFMVSYNALFIKICEYLNVNIIIWKNYARHESEKKEYRVYQHFPKYNNAEKSIWLPNGCTVKHISPNPYTEEHNLQNAVVYDDFKIIMKDKITNCSAFTFMFPHSRNLNHNLPIFDNLTIKDESTYDNCFIMFVSNDKTRFNRIKESYFKNDI